MYCEQTVVANIGALSRIEARKQTVRDNAFCWIVLYHGSVELDWITNVKTGLNLDLNFKMNSSNPFSDIIL